MMQTVTEPERYQLISSPLLPDIPTQTPERLSTFYIPGRRQVRNQSSILEHHGEMGTSHLRPSSLVVGDVIAHDPEDTSRRTKK
jgi:hypothetical protein